MVLRWTDAPRGEAEKEVCDALTRCAGAGVVLAGPAGVGKTVLARMAVQRHCAERHHAALHWVSATSSAKLIPFGAMSHLFDVTLGASPTEILRQARTSIAPAGCEVVVVVDDAHLLDDYSAALIHQLSTVSGAHVLVTVRNGEPVPGAIAQLRKDRTFSRVDVGPMTRDETTTLVEQVLGGPLDPDSAGRIFAMSQGNPLFVRHLVDGAELHGNLHSSDGVWRLRGDTVITRELVDLIDGRLAVLPASVRHVMEYLSLEEPLAVSVLSALTGAAAVEDAENTQMVRVTPLGGSLVVFPSHPLLTERLRQSTGSLTARRLRTELVRCLTDNPADDAAHLSAQLRRIAMAVDSDSPPPLPDLLDAVWKALFLNDFVLTEQLASAALQRSEALPARLALAHAQCWQGHGHDAEATLDEVDADTLADQELVHWAVSKACNEFWVLDQGEAAMSWLATVRARLHSTSTQHTLDGLAAQFAKDLGRSQRCIDLATPVLAAPDSEDVAVAWASAAAALCSARMGRFEHVDELTNRCLQVVHPDAVRYTAVLGQVQAAILDGRLSAAEDNARHHLTLAECRQPGHATGQVVLSYALIAAGDLTGAAAVLRVATQYFTDTNSAWGALDFALLAIALGQLGDATGAALALAEAERMHGPRVALHYPELCLGRAWSMAAAHNMPGAIAAARAAIAEASRSGQHAQALLAHHDAIRLGDTSGVAQLSRLADRLDCALAPIVLEHARGLASRDGTRLQAVSALLSQRGMIPAAADAAAQAAAAYATANSRSKEVAAAGIAADLRRRSNGLDTPALRAALSPLPLTGREREIALMVAAGDTNKAIADRLSLSVRTVESHIYNACAKADVASRTDLAQAVNASRNS